MRNKLEKIRQSVASISTWREETSHYYLILGTPREKTSHCYSIRRAAKQWEARFAKDTQHI